MLILGFVLALVVVAVLYFCWTNECIGQLLVILIIAGAITKCNRSDWWQESERQKDAKLAAQDLAESTPHVIREFDGCKVYTFKSGNWHYFTRCGTNTVTEAHRSETTGSGKNARTVDVTETIPLEVK